MVIGHSRGNIIKFIDSIWVYEDGVPLTKEERPCTRCGQMPNTDGSDACLGHIGGATSACCGHGKKKDIWYAMVLLKIYELVKWIF